MPRDGIDEDDIFDDDDFGEDFEDDENEKENGKDDQYEELVKRAKAEAEQAVVDALATNDPNSPVYKGLQRHLNARNREIAELKNQITVMAQLTEKSRQAYNSVEFIEKTLPEMLDPKDREVYERRRGEFTNQKRTEQLEEQVRFQQQRPQMQSPSQEEFETTIEQYKKQAESQMRELAEVAGVDPTDKRLDYGTDNENYVQRLARLKASIIEVKKEDDDVESVRRKRQPITRTRGEPSERSALADDIVARGTAQMLERMRKV